MSSSFSSDLFVRNGRGRYRPADPDQILEAARQLVGQRLQRGMLLSDPSMACEFLRLQMATLEHEVFAAILLDTKHRVLEFVELFRGTIDGAEVHPREVVKTVLAANAAAVIVAHNHPSGCAEPSAADRAVTAQLKQALALVDVRLLDHFVVGQNVVSMAARGWV